MSYVQVFGGSNVRPSQAQFIELALTAGNSPLQLSWPLEAIAGSNLAADIVLVALSVTGLSVKMPDAREAPLGSPVLFINNGSQSFEVNDKNGGNITVVPAGVAKQLFLEDNTTEDGVWQVIAYGSTTSSADASALAGAGLRALSGRLAQDAPATSLSSNYSIGAADRAKHYLWTGGAGTLTLPSGATVGDGFNFSVRNTGGGTLALTPSSGQINGSASLNMNPDDSAFVFTDGSNWFTIGLGKTAIDSTTAGSLSITALSSPYTLTSTEYGYSILALTGTLTADLQLIFPSTPRRWVILNNTSGAFDIHARTAGQTPPGVQLEGNSFIFGDGVNIYGLSGSGLSNPVPINQGGTGATTASSARTNLGATSVGNAMFIAADEAAGRAAISAVSQSTAIKYAAGLG